MKSIILNNCTVTVKTVLQNKKPHACKLNSGRCHLVYWNEVCATNSIQSFAVSFSLDWMHLRIYWPPSLIIGVPSQFPAEFVHLRKAEILTTIKYLLGEVVECLADLLWYYRSFIWEWDSFIVLYHFNNDFTKFLGTFICREPSKCLDCRVGGGVPVQVKRGFGNTTRRLPPRRIPSLVTWFYWMEVTSPSIYR